jgi:hypothetical protein
MRPDDTKTATQKLLVNLYALCFIEVLRLWRWNVERRIGRALAGNPSPDIADELRDLLLDAVYSQRQAI